MSYKSVIQFWTNYQLPVQPPSPNMYTKTIVAAAGQATNSIFLSFLATAFINLAKIVQASHEASLEGCRVSSKSPSSGPKWRRGSCWEELKIIVFPQQGVIDLPQPNQ